MKNFKLNWKKIGLTGSIIILGTTIGLSPLYINETNNSKVNASKVYIDKEEIDTSSISVDNLFEELMLSEIKDENSFSSKNALTIEDLNIEKQDKIKDFMAQALNHIENFGIDENFNQKFLGSNLEINDSNLIHQDHEINNNDSKTFFKNSFRISETLGGRISYLNSKAKDLRTLRNAMIGVSASLGVIAAGALAAAWFFGLSLPTLAAATATAAAAIAITIVVDIHLEKILNTIRELRVFLPTYGSDVALEVIKDFVVGSVWAYVFGSVSTLLWNVFAAKFMAAAVIPKTPVVAGVFAAAMAGLVYVLENLFEGKYSK